MSAKKEQKSERSKKADKIMPEMHREFLDMDTDEENFGRQETPETEEELPPEPEKPVFSEQDLIALVEHVKSLVVLPSLKPSDWNDDCHEVIREYFQNPSHSILSISYKKNILIASLHLPRCASNGFTYFLRSPGQIYTVQNFFSTVLFGSINENVENCLLKFMENIYAPIVLNDEDCPSLIRNDLFSSLHEFLMILIDEVYAPKGMTILYIPKEHLLKTFLEPSNKIDCYLLGENNVTKFSELDERREKLLGRLENIIWHWVRQIREATKPKSKRRIVGNILDEVNYWISMQTNLNHLRDQFSNSDVRLIIDTLRNFRSPSVELFCELTARVEMRLEEASSNIMYLSVLTVSCENSRIPEEIDDFVTRALLLILFIWTESPFYNTTDNIETLLRALSSQIVQECRKFIKLDIALGVNPEDGIQMLQKCILCCDNYKKIYGKVIKNIAERMGPGKEWDISEMEVFNNIDTFRGRCYDVIDICKTLIVFGRCNKVGLLGSPKGTEYEAYCGKIESIFYESFKGIIMVRDEILDVAKNNWFKKFGKFRNTVVQLENMVKNLINDIFKEVQNIEEGIEAIYALQKFKQRECLREILDSKWTQVWNIFDNDVKYFYVTTVVEKEKYDRSMHQETLDINLLCIMNYLKNQYATMIDASDWIGDCAAENISSAILIMLDPDDFFPRSYRLSEPRVMLRNVFTDVLPKNTNVYWMQLGRGERFLKDGICDS